MVVLRYCLVHGVLDAVLEIVEAEAELLNLLLYLLYLLKASKLGRYMHRILREVLISSVLLARRASLPNHCLPQLHHALILLEALRGVLYRPLAHLLHHMLHLFNLLSYQMVELVL